MKRNCFDPFMINNFTNVINESKSVSISSTESMDNDIVGMTFMEKSSSMRIPKVRTGLVLLITSDVLGENNELGINLMKDFCTAVVSGLDLPEYVFFINSGVKLIGDSGLIEKFKKLKKYGTKIITSVESLQYFNIEKNRMAQAWAIGDITTVVITASKVIKL